MERVRARQKVDLIGEAEAELRRKQADHAAELRVREQLLRQITLLESVAQDNSLASLMHRMILRTLQMQEESAALEEAVATAAVPSFPPLQLNDLPLSLGTFDDKMLQRAAEMNMDDVVRIYKSFVDRAHFAVAHVKCHGEHSYMKQELAEIVSRFSNLMMLHGFLLLPIQTKYLKMNFFTLREEEAPPGWYAHIARLIPVHKDFAALVQAGIVSAQKTVDREFDSKGDVLQQVRQLMRHQDPAVVVPFDNLVHLDQVDNLLDRCGRCATSVLLLRTMLGVYIFAGSLRFFDAVVVGETMMSCWPYSIRGMLVYEEYWKRDDVQAVVQNKRGVPQGVPQGNKVLEGGKR